MIWWARERKTKQKASIKQKANSLKTGEKLCKIINKKEKAQRKLKSPKNTEMLQFKYVRYCEYIYANEAQNTGNRSTPTKMKLTKMTLQK